MAFACSVRMRGGDSIPVWDSSTPLRLLSHLESFEYFLRFLRRDCGFLRIFGFVGVAFCCDPTFIAYPYDLLT